MLRRISGPEREEVGGAWNISHDDELYEFTGN
jgi:hypothetical protein